MPREDYKEIMELCLLILGEPVYSNDESYHFWIPGAYHLARWMWKVIYCFKIYLSVNTSNSHLLKPAICLSSASLQVRHKSEHGSVVQFHEMLQWMICCCSIRLYSMAHSGGATPWRARSNDLEDPPPWFRPACCFASVMVWTENKNVTPFGEKSAPQRKSWLRPWPRVTWLEDFLTFEITWLLYCAGAATEDTVSKQVSDAAKN